MVSRRSGLGNYNHELFENETKKIDFFFGAGYFEPSSDMYTSLQNWRLRVWGGQAVPH